MTSDRERLAGPVSAPTARPSSPPSPRVVRLREAVDEQRAETSELRAEIRKILDSWDAEPPDVVHAPVAPTRRRRGRGGLAAAVAAVTLVAGAGVLLSRPDGDDVSTSVVSTATRTSAGGAVGQERDGAPSLPGVDGPAGSASPMRSGAASAQASAVHGPQAGQRPSVAAAIRPLPWDGRAVLVPPDLPSSGPGITTPGTFAATAIDPVQNVLSVYESVVTAGPAQRITFAPPTFPMAARPRLIDLQGTVDGVPVTLGGNQTTGWTAVVPSGAAGRTVVLRYRLVGIVVSGARGRRQAPVVPLSLRVSQAAHLPVVVQVVDRNVQSMNCLGSASGCASPRKLAGKPLAWTATLPAHGAYGVPVLVLGAG